MSDQEKRQQLKKHKYLATGLFIAMACIYTGMVFLDQHSPQAWVGYVKAFSEAGMVGALADWFAVTALFKHPLGIPIPHTNLIERKKEDLGKNLGHFINENFLNATTIRPYIENLDVPKIMVNWLENPKNRQGLENEINQLLQKIISDLNDREVHQFLTKKGTELLYQVDYAQLIETGIKYMVRKEEHIVLLESLLPQLKNYILQNDQLILKRLSENKPFIAFLAGKKITKELTEGLVAFIEEIEEDKHHFIRKKLTESIEDFAEEINSTTKWRTKIATLKKELILPKNLEKYVKDLWEMFKELIEKQLNNPTSPLQRVLSENISKLSQSLKQDEKLRFRLNHWAHFFLYRLILKNRMEIEALISTTVSNWEAKTLSEKLELEVGKDLQFIRVNGTLVGGLVGLLIYLLTHFFIS